HGAGPDLLRACPGEIDRGLAVHAGRLRGVRVERIGGDDPHAVMLPFGISAHGFNSVLARARRVGKIVSRGVAAWARRVHDFAHAEKPYIAPLPTLRATTRYCPRRPALAKRWASSAARNSAFDLLMHSCCSAEGSESATMPAPVCTYMRPSLASAVLSTMQDS